MIGGKPRRLCAEEKGDYGGNVNLLSLMGSYYQNGSSSAFAGSSVGAECSEIRDVELKSGVKLSKSGEEIG